MIIKGEIYESYGRHNFNQGIQVNSTSYKTYGHHGKPWYSDAVRWAQYHITAVTIVSDISDCLCARCHTKHFTSIIC